MFSWVRDKPRFVPENYKEVFASPCEKFKESGQEWYKRTGIPPEEHPLKGNIWFSGCENCESEKVKVIAAQWSVSFHSGDQYFDYELFCENCGKYTQRAFADND